MVQGKLPHIHFVILDVKLIKEITICTWVHTSYHIVPTANLKIQLGDEFNEVHALLET